MKTFKLALLVFSFTAFSVSTNLQSMACPLWAEDLFDDPTDSLLKQIEDNLEESYRTYKALHKILKEMKEQQTKEPEDSITMEGIPFNDDTLQSLVKVMKKNQEDDAKTLVIKSIMLLSLRVILFDQILNNKNKKPVALNELYLLYFWWIRNAAQDTLITLKKRLPKQLEEKLKQFTHSQLTDDQNKLLNSLVTKAKECLLYKFMQNEARKLREGNLPSQAKAANSDGEGACAVA